MIFRRKNMRLEFKKLLVLVAFTAVLPLVIGGCSKKVAYPNCKKDVDCRVDATGKEVNGVCYQGKCEECAADTDCSDLKQCVNNRCLAACTADADCGAGNHCESNFCVADCTSNDACSSGQSCNAGRCVAQVEASVAVDQVSAVLFDFDRFNVKSEYQDRVDAAAAYLEKNQDAKVTLRGHTDETGTPTYNMVLGQKRADAVSHNLKAKGIAPTRITTISLGEQEPAVNEKTEYAYGQNRRVEFVFEK